MITKASMAVARAAISVSARSGSLSSFRRSFASLHPTSALLEKLTMKVPTMGDSITEGTIVEWTAGVGQAVKEGDVVALVETDKVTVDIKADTDGVIVEHFGAVDDTVEVGGDLYVIDTAATATVTEPPVVDSVPAATPDAALPVAAAPAAPPTPVPAPTVSVPAAGGRSPSIHFLGKAGWAARRGGGGALTGASPPQQQPEAHIGPMYGRPRCTEEEMEALIDGGATLAPSVRSPSGGALFG